jgi:hypothetical protein
MVLYVIFLKFGLIVGSKKSIVNPNKRQKGGFMIAPSKTFPQK